MLATTLQSGRHLRAGLVYVQHLRTIPLSIRDHGGGGDHGLLLVSFTLTPMMSARLMQRQTTLSSEDAAARARGFYAGLIAPTHGCSIGRCAHRFAGDGDLPLLVMLSSIPLYGLIKQDFIPSNIDEAEFDVNVTAPEGTSLVSMNEVLEPSKPS